MTPESGRHLVLFDAYPHSFTGTARSAGLLARGLADRGWTSEVVLPAEGPVADGLRARSVPVTIVPAPPALLRYGRESVGWRGSGAAVRLPAYWRRIARHLRGRADVLHVTSQRSVLLAAPAARAVGCPVLWQVSGIEEGRVVQRICARLASATVATSTVARDSTPRGHGAPLLPPPLDPQFTETPLVARPVTPPVVACVARFDPVKDHDLLLDAFGLVLQRVSDARLRLIGDVQVGHEAHACRIRQRAESLRPAGAVEFVGWSDHPERHLADVAAYVSTSQHEGLGLSIAEAMACGVPAVFPNTVGLRDHVEAGVSAIVIADRTPAAFADAIVELVTDDGRARRIGSAGRSAVQALSVDIVAGRLATMLDDVVAGRPVR